MQGLGSEANSARGRNMVELQARHTVSTRRFRKLDGVVPVHNRDGEAGRDLPSQFSGAVTMFFSNGRCRTGSLLKRERRRTRGPRIFFSRAARRHLSSPDARNSMKTW